ncbi:hypothetical protein SDC9_178608 [bioreactor metagenome]|uniref:Uncharacterized protein n=1 Tax=bioreactor metagenome TaxID=1076179 RepID=A0A645H483_9ZZZZ
MKILLVSMHSLISFRYFHLSGIHWIHLRTAIQFVLLYQKKTDGISIWCFGLLIHTMTFSYPLKNRLSNYLVHRFHTNLLMMVLTGILLSSITSQVKSQFHCPVQSSCLDFHQEPFRFFLKVRTQPLRKYLSWLDWKSRKAS